MWYDEAVIYQIYPLGLCGAPLQNDGDPSQADQHRLLRVLDWVDHIKALGATCVLFNPLFESDAHGYDTRDYNKVDCRLGTNDDLKQVCAALHAAGIPTVVWLSPILPFLNDTEENILGILNSCKEAGVMGVVCFGMGLTLRDGSREYFYKQLDRLFPGLKERYMETYGDSYFLPSPNNDALMQLFHDTCEKYGMLHDNDAIFSYLRTFEEKNQPEQIRLF